MTNISAPVPSLSPIYNVSSVIRSTSLEQSQAKFPLPYHLLTGLYYFEKTHVIYRNVKFALLFKKNHETPLLGHPFIYGSVLGAIAPLMPVTSYALQLALITKCVSDITNQYERLYKAYNKFQDALYDRYPLYDSTKTDPSGELVLTPSSFYKVCGVRITRLSNKIFKICRTISLLFWEILRLSMCLQDAKLFAEGDASQKHYACTELVVEWQAYVNSLNNPKTLIAEMNNSSLMADTILNKVKSNTTFCNLMKMIKMVFDQIKNNYIVKEFHKAAIDTAGQLLGNGNLALGLTFRPTVVIDNQYADERYIPWAGQKIRIVEVAPLIIKEEKNINNDYLSPSKSPSAVLPIVKINPEPVFTDIVHKPLDYVCGIIGVPSPRTIAKYIDAFDLRTLSPKKLNL